MTVRVEGEFILNPVTIRLAQTGYCDGCRGIFAGIKSVAPAHSQKFRHYKAVMEIIPKEYFDSDPSLAQ